MPLLHAPWPVPVMACCMSQLPDDSAGAVLLLRGTHEAFNSLKIVLVLGWLCTAKWTSKPCNFSSQTPGVFFFILPRFWYMQ